MYTQKANGTIDLKVIPGGTHCGIDDNMLHLTYAICLTFDDDALDESGFLLDNTSFRGYWTAMSTVAIDYSCELLAMKVGKDLAAMAGPHLRSISVELSPFQGVSVTWISGELKH
jgi:hypothetical protein